MFEDGFVGFVQSNQLVAAISGGGWTVQIPSEIDAYTKPLWTWFFVTDKPDTGLQFYEGMIEATVQIDVYGATYPLTASLAYAINTALQGAQGLLGDANQTQLTSCFRTERRIFPYDPDSRIYRIMLEFGLTYYVNEPGGLAP